MTIVKMLLMIIKVTGKKWRERGVRIKGGDRENTSLAGRVLAGSVRKVAFELDF